MTLRPLAALAATLALLQPAWADETLQVTLTELNAAGSGDVKGTVSVPKSSDD